MRPFQVVIASAFATLLSVSAAAQTPQNPGQTPQNPALPEAQQTDSSPINVVFLSARDEFSRLPGGAWQNAFILRSDRAFLSRKRGWISKVGLLTRADLPIVSRSFGRETPTGLGDLYLQLLAVPKLTRRAALAFGSGFQLPTATDDRLGTGKWQAVPTVVPIWFLPGGKGMAFLKLQGRLSFAGDPSRRSVTVLTFSPTVLFRTGSRSWLLAETEGRHDYRPPISTTWRSMVEMGRVVGSRTAVALKPQWGWGSDRLLDWGLTVVIIRYQKR